MGVIHLYQRLYFIKVVVLAALPVLAIVASGQEAVKNATRQNGSAVSPNNQTLSIKNNASFATSFRNKGNTQPSRAKVSCAKEIDLANKFILNWAKSLDGLMSEAIEADPDQRNSTLVRDAALLRESFNAFGANLNKQPIEKEIQNLVTLKRRTNRLALSVYLKTFNPAWPQNSAQLASTVERVQLACMPSQDRAAMLVLNSPFRANNLVQHNHSY